MTRENLGSCSSCGTAFQTEGDIIFHDRGKLCSTCESSVEIAQAMKKSWKVEAHGIALTPILLSLLSYFCINPFYLITVATFVASITAIVFATRVRIHADAPPLTSGQKATMAMGGAVGLFAVAYMAAVVWLQPFG